MKRSYDPSEIDRPTGAPTLKRRKFVVWSVQPGDENVFRIVQPKIEAVTSHYILDEMRSVFCTGKEETCPIPHSENRPRWCAYCLAQMTRPKTAMVILHITPGLGAQMPKLCDETVNLVGAELRLWRRRGNNNKGTKRSPVDGSLELAKWPSTQPYPFDLFAHIVEMYSADNNERARTARLVQSINPQKGR